MIKNLKIKNFLIFFSINLAFFSVANSSSEEAKIDRQDQKPHIYLVPQQVGAVCFLSCWDNYKKLQNIRNNNNGEILDKEFKPLGLCKSRYEWFLETAEHFYKWYEIFRSERDRHESPFESFINRVLKGSITIEDGKDYIARLDPQNQLAAPSFFPHLLSRKDNHLDANIVRLPSTTDSKDQKVKIFGHIMIFKTHQMLDDNRVFYNYGLYKLMLMALGVKKDNTLIADGATDQESLEILQFNKAMQASDNPWKAINPEHFLEYRVAQLFKEDNALKQQAAAVVDVFFKTFGFYQDAKNLELVTKMQDLPGEEQMLAYCFCHNLRNVYAASISEKALTSILELEDEQVKALKSADMDPLELFRKRFTSLKSISFSGVWQTIKQKLNLRKNQDMVSFSSHGSVFSFDQRALSAQKFENKEIANLLGFTMIDSGYADGLKPFYQYH